MLSFIAIYRQLYKIFKIIQVSFFWDTVYILECLYKYTTSAVRVDGGLSHWFMTAVDALHGRIPSPLLFNILSLLQVLIMCMAYMVMKLCLRL